MLLRKLDNPHFYCCIADDANASGMDLLRERFNHVHIKRVPQPEPPIAEPGGQSFLHAPHPLVNHDQQACLRQQRNLFQTWEFLGQENPGGFDPDDAMVVRLRPDLWFHDFSDLPRNPYPMEAITPWWGAYGGVNDRVAFLGCLAAKEWFTTFTKLDALLQAGCPMHQETMIRASLEQANCIITETLTCLCSILRENGNAEMPDLTRPIGMIDFARFVAKTKA